MDNPQALVMRVRAMFPPGHVRTPSYLRGKIGTIERQLGPFGNPEQLAYRQKPDQKILYRVRFRMGDIWDNPENPDDTLDAEIYAHWLEPLDAT
jgi:nitrile hydratase